MTLFSSQDSKPKADKLKKLLDQKGIVVMPGCYDALSAKLIEREELNVGFMSGFAVSSTRLGMPDTGSCDALCHSVNASEAYMAGGALGSPPK